MMYRAKWKRGAAVFLAALTLTAGPLLPAVYRAGCGSDGGAESYGSGPSGRDRGGFGELYGGDGNQ